MTIEGAHCPDQLPAVLESLPIIGGGARKVFIFKPYVVALYARESYSTIHQVMASPGPKCIRLTVLSDLVTGAMLAKGLKDGLDRTTGGRSGALTAPVAALFSTLEGWSIGKGDVAHILHAADGGIRLFHDLEMQFEDATPGFAEALFGIWFSDSFSEKKLQRQLLGKE